MLNNNNKGKKMDMDQNKKVGQSIEELTNAMEKAVNNGKKPNWWGKNKNIIKDITGGLGISVFVIVGCIFIVYVFNKFVDEQHMRVEQDAERAFKRALQQQQNTSDTIAYNAQNSR